MDLLPTESSLGNYFPLPEVNHCKIVVSLNLISEKTLLFLYSFL